MKRMATLLALLAIFQPSAAKALDELDGRAPTVLVTPSLFRPSAEIFCQALNVSDSPLRVSVKIADDGGNAIGEWCKTQELQPGMSCMSDHQFELPKRSVHCTFTFQGPKDSIRGNIRFIEYDEDGRVRSAFSLEAR